MKEVICDEALFRKKPVKTEREIIKKELKKILPRFYTIDSGSFGIFYISKFVPFGSLGKRAKIFHQSLSTIKVGDKKLYSILKQFGEKHGYVKLVKCWRGCEKEGD